jgi:N-carbamoyl-L-amino-acid hydrolase
VPDDFERMWADLSPVGRSATSGGYFRQPFTSPERELAAWFLEACAARDLAVETDAFGNSVGWWRPDGGIVRHHMDADAPETRPSGDGLSRRSGVLTGSHLDSVLDGGAYDGPLGVVSALAAIDELRDRGFVPTKPIGVGVFVEEEGSRFGLACLGSRLATGAITWDVARELRDRDGIALADVLDADPPEQLGRVDLLAGVEAFVELHVEQGRDLVDRGAAVGIASEIWPHGRYRFDFTGEANHAGSTRMADRKDPMLTYAMAALAANKQARLVDERATFGRLEVVPNGTNAVPSRVSAWLDARASSDEALAELVDAISRQARERADRDETELEITAESVSGSVTFDPALVGRDDWPVIPTAAGHDAGVLSAAGIPTAMLFVRNPTGISHSPAEHAEVPDCLAGVHALADTLERLAT